MKFRCCNCNKGEFESNERIVSEHGIDTFIEIPIGWQRTYYNHGMSVCFTCPDCIASMQVAERMFALKDTPKMIENGMFSDVNLINIRLHAESIIESCERKLKMKEIKE